jgi:hypothetical protein
VIIAGWFASFCQIAYTSNFSSEKTPGVAPGVSGVFTFSFHGKEAFAIYEL